MGRSPPAVLHGAAALIFRHCGPGGGEDSPGAGDDHRVGGARAATA
ncbi:MULTISPECIES: hypothetical protein [unclassified Microbacterium]|nr:hypothetical protein [Microbacterium sp. MAH-37]MVQ42146.1 hypothetical protein [Microbacterium sp. MAH-37]